MTLTQYAYHNLLSNNRRKKDSKQKVDIFYYFNKEIDIKCLICLFVYSVIDLMSLLKNSKTRKRKFNCL